MRLLGIFMILILLVIQPIYSEEIFYKEIKPISDNDLTFLNVDELKVPRFGFIQKGYFYYYKYTIENTKYINVILISNKKHKLYILNKNNFEIFRKTGSISDYIYYTYSNNSFLNIEIKNPDDYYIVLSPEENDLVIFYAYVTDKKVNLSLPYGISDYGIDFINNRIYTYNTTQLVGKVTLYSYNIRIPEYCISNVLPNKREFTVQLNSVLKIDNEYYWVQNVLYIKEDKVLLAINIWNESDKFSILDKDSIKGNGGIYEHENSFFYFYSYAPKINKNYIDIYLITNIKKDVYPIIQFGYSLDGKNIIWYDNVTLYVKYNNAYFLVYPNVTPHGVPINVELVLGGPENRSCIYFNDIDGNLELYFLYIKNGKEYYSPVIYGFNFGGHTGEEAYNIKVIPLSEGSVKLESGFDMPKSLSFKNYYQITVKEFFDSNIKVSKYILRENEYFVLNLSEYIYIDEFSRYRLDCVYIEKECYKTNLINISTNKNLEIDVIYKKEYLVNIESQFPFYVNGKYYINSYIDWVEENSTLEIEPKYTEIYLNNNQTRYVWNYNSKKIFLNVSDKIFMNLLKFFDKEHKVIIDSVVPYTLCYLECRENIEELWVKENSSIKIILNDALYFNRTRYILKDNIKELNLIVKEPIKLNISEYYLKQYFIKIKNPYRVNISIKDIIYNDNVEEWINEGSLIKIFPYKKVDDYLFFKRIVEIKGNEFIVNKPLDIELNGEIYYEINYINLFIFIGLLTIILIKKFI